jgi:hypothetical protein
VQRGVQRGTILLRTGSMFVFSPLLPFPLLSHVSRRTPLANSRSKRNGTTSRPSSHNQRTTRSSSPQRLSSPSPPKRQGRSQPAERSSGGQTRCAKLSEQGKCSAGHPLTPTSKILLMRSSCWRPKHWGCRSFTKRKARTGCLSVLWLT